LVVARSEPERRPAATVATPPPSIPVEAERKQLTVLFASVKGATDVEADLDSEEWAVVMDQYLRILQDSVIRFDGRVDKFTGEGVMALFGAPIALEDHAARACWAALHMLQACAVQAATLERRGLHFSVRIGLNSGEAVVGRLGDNLKVDPTALGHTVGLAQRMQSGAGPGEAYLTERTARLVRGTFALTDLGQQEVKGARVPIGVSRLEGLLGQEEAGVATSTTFVGRSVEIALLEDALAEANRGQAQIVGVAGDAGLG
jgi:class 3 adenylate cyclase